MKIDCILPLASFEHISSVLQWEIINCNNYEVKLEFRHNWRKDQKSFGERESSCDVSHDSNALISILKAFQLSELLKILFSVMETALFFIYLPFMHFSQPLLKKSYSSSPPQKKYSVPWLIGWLVDWLIDWLLMLTNFTHCSPVLQSLGYYEGCITIRLLQPIAGELKIIAERRALIMVSLFPNSGRGENF